MYNGLEKFFLFSAFLGGLLFLVRFLIQLLGADQQGDTDIIAGHADVNHVEPDASFKLLTIQGLTAFFMMFGLVGFTLLRETRVHQAIAMFGAVLAGLGTVWIIGAIFNFTKRLQSSGTMDISEMVGAEGNIYLTITAGGTGKVTVNAKGRQREYEAVSADGAEIKTGDSIRVIGIRGERLVVERIS